MILWTCNITLIAKSLVVSYLLSFEQSFWNCSRTVWIPFIKGDRLKDDIFQTLFMTALERASRTSVKVQLIVRGVWVFPEHFSSIFNWTFLPSRSARHQEPALPLTLNWLLIPSVYWKARCCICETLNTGNYMLVDNCLTSPPPLPPLIFWFEYDVVFYTHTQKCTLLFKGSSSARAEGNFGKDRLQES